MGNNEAWQVRTIRTPGDPRMHECLPVGVIEIEAVKYGVPFEINSTTFVQASCGTADLGKELRNTIAIMNADGR